MSIVTTSKQATSRMSWNQLVTNWTSRQTKYFEVSAKTGENVAKAMMSILGDIDKLADQGKSCTDDLTLSGRS
jgi:translation initiation factor IF-2